MLFTGLRVNLLQFWRKPGPYPHTPGFRWKWSQCYNWRLYQKGSTADTGL